MFGHAVHKNDTDWIKKKLHDIDVEVDGARQKRRPRKNWYDCVKDMKSLALSQPDAQSKSKWPPCLFSVRPHR